MTDEPLMIPSEWSRDDEWVVLRGVGPAPFPEWDYGRSKHQIRGEAGIQKHAGNEAPYFFATYDIYLGSDRLVGAGTMGEDALRLWPEVAVVARVHLCEPDGRPMHAVGNAVYWLGRSGFPEARDHAALKRHLRITDEELAQIVRTVDVDGQPPEWYVLKLGELIDGSGVEARWAEEAAAARRWIETGEQ